MRSPRDDDHDIRTLIERGSSTWVGPSPRARRSRWATEERPRRSMSIGLAAAGLGVAALLAGSLALVVTSQSPDTAAASVMRLVSHVFTIPPGAQPGSSPAPSPPASPAAPAAGAPTPSGGPTPRATRAPSPSPWRSDRPGAHWPSPTASPSGPAASPTPFPTPSRTPDE